MTQPLLNSLPRQRVEPILNFKVMTRVMTEVMTQKIATKNAAKSVVYGAKK